MLAWTGQEDLCSSIDIGLHSKLGSERWWPSALSWSAMSTARIDNIQLLCRSVLKQNHSTEAKQGAIQRLGRALASEEQSLLACPQRYVPCHL